METIVDNLYTANEYVSFLGVVISELIWKYQCHFTSVLSLSSNQTPVVITVKLEYNGQEYSEFMNVQAKSLYEPIENCHKYWTWLLYNKFTALTSFKTPAGKILTYFIISVMNIWRHKNY